MSRLTPLLFGAVAGVVVAAGLVLYGIDTIARIVIAVNPKESK